jgi:hypothetical protein
LVGDAVLIGYSCWGFLGHGILNTPDGGRSHRRTLIDGLRQRGHQVVFLQTDRDLYEAGVDLRSTYSWSDGFPDIDVLFCEWRWPISGRNTTPCRSRGHTCDLHRQQDLLDHYTFRSGLPTILWDKDRKLPRGSPLRRLPHVIICEAALDPSPDAVSLLFPVSDTELANADPNELAEMARDLPLVYIGNQYDRDAAFDQFFAPAARQFEHVVAGKWSHTKSWPQVRFGGRIAFGEIDPLYRQSLTTVLLLPDRYARTAQMTQRLFEAVLSGCLPLTPITIRGADVFTPAQLHVASGADVIDRIAFWRWRAGSPAHAEIIASCLHRLDLFRCSRQLDTLEQIFSMFTTPGTASR